VSEEARVARSAGVVGTATMVSRVLGLLREQVMASLFGAGFATDAFNVAFRIPNLLRDLFAEGAMSSAFVPTFTAVRERDGDRAAFAFGRQLMSTLLVGLTVLCIAGALLAPWIVQLFAPGFAAVPGKQELTVQLTRIMLPFLPMVAMAAVAMGMLNALGRFALPAFAPALLNLGMIAGGLALIGPFAAAGQPPVVAMAVGLLIGGVLPFAVQLPSLARLGFSARLERPAFPPPVRRVAVLMLPAAIGLAAVQLNVMVSTFLASLLEQGSVSWLWYAFRLMQLPIGVFGVALATVSLPALSRAAVTHDLAALKTTLSATLRLVGLLTIPAALWLAVMARPVVALLYEHGRFAPADTERTAGALVMYCVGLPAFAAIAVVSRTFYALGDTRRPVVASFVSVALNLGLNLLLMKPLGHLGLALSASLTAIVNLLQLVYHLRARLGPLEGRRMLRTALRVGGAAVLVCGLNGAALWALEDRWHGGFVAEAVVVATSLLVAVPLGWLALRLLKVEELAAAEAAAAALRRRVLGR
jgi:putative peptidoglycan lipid II flippase